MLLADYFPKDFILQKKEVEICQTDIEHKPLILFSKKLINNVKLELRKEFLWNYLDCISLVYYYNAKNLKEAKSIIKNFIYNESRKAKNEDNEIDKFNAFFMESEKFCPICKEMLPINLYYKETDKRTGFVHYKKICKSCTKISKAEQRKRYRSTPEAKLKAKIRWERYKLNHGRK